MTALKELYPEVKFRVIAEGKDGDIYTYDISDKYKTNAPDEEVLCPFLNPLSGCTLPSELKPFDCKIWPLRAVRTPDNSIKVVLTPTCPSINRLPLQKVCDFTAGGPGSQIIEYAESHPEIIKEYSAFLSQIVFSK